ncbi:MAG: monovalent cation:proton antiporter-2 (CPA2) family protein [Rhodospirillales bacterium]|nr:monovalent cation:proton antiporter-2 (CPA2) family protein [Rhodospirillales bacterium]
MLAEAAIFLTAAVLTVPVSRRLGLGAVLGYLIAGAVIGPGGLGFVFNVNDVLHFAEFGVVLLLFIIGLELQPNRLWTMRKAIFGMGAAQVAATGVVLAAAAWALGIAPAPAVLIGLTLALSSTAFALQNLAEKGELTMRHGRAAFSILLFQDLAAIPLIAVVPLLSAGAAGAGGGADLLEAGKIVLVLAAVSIGGRYALRYALRIVALTNTRELFTAMALLVVVAVSLVMQSLGLSMALGAFLAGVLLADSEYRHALEADIEPFKGLLLGLFFMSVGMSLNLGMIVAEPLTVAAMVAGLIGIKFAILYAVGRINGLEPGSSRALAIAVSQGGEFAFVIFAVAAGTGVLGRDEADLLKAVVTLSMATTPLLSGIDAIAERRRRGRPAAAAYDDPPEEHRQVIIAGFGRFGQIVARMLRAKKIPFTALEISPDQVDFVRAFGNEVFYGDASRIDLLRAAKAEDASAFVLAIDDPDASVRTAETVRKNFPNLPIYARARNRNHAYRLMDAGVRVVWRETFLSSLDMAGAVLSGLGYREREVKAAIETFRSHDERRLYAHHGLHNDAKRMQDLAKAAAKELEELFAADAAADPEAGPEAGRADGPAPRRGRPDHVERVAP